MMAHHPTCCKLTVNDDVGKFLGNKVHNFMYDMNMHIINKYHTPKDGNVEVNLDISHVIQSYHA